MSDIIAKQDEVTTAASNAASALSSHEADTTSIHGIANTANLYASGGTDVAVADGGTGAGTAAGARTNLGLGTAATAATGDFEAAGVVATHAGAADPHTVYQLESGLAGAITATKLDDFTAPDDNTDLNATTGVHGLLPKLGGGSTNFLRADGTWNAPAGGSGAPDTADYLVGTAQAGLSAEIVVGTAPGGELGGTWASPTVDATHSGTSHAGLSGQPGSTDVAVADGGTGASTAAGARTNLGIGDSAPAEGRSKNAFDTALTAPGIDFASVGTLALAAAQTYYYPIYVVSSITLDRIVCEVTTAGAASKLIQLGIYNADVDWQPTSRVLDAGTVTADSIAVKTITISQVLAAGRYLLAANTDGTPTLRAYRSMARFMGFLSTMGTAPFFSRASIASQTIIGTGFPSTGVVWSNYSGSSVGFDYTVFVRVVTP